MPVVCGVEVHPVDQERFHHADKAVMQHVFDIHNALGRFCDERIYQEELARRCRASGYVVHREVSIRVSHKSFIKPYYLDILLDHGMIYELKTVEALNKRHQKQVINYLLLAGLRHGKLVNFLPVSIESRFVSTTLGRDDRMTYQIADADWQGDDEASARLRTTFCALLDDWGAFLDVGLYREALLHLLSGHGAGIQPIEIAVTGHVIGTQKMCVLNAGTAWHLSALRQHFSSYETHVMRLLNHLRLKRIHWININQRHVTFKTLIK